MLSTLVALLLTPSPARAQGADERWQTLQTEHYRLHSPEVALPWAWQVASRLEEIRARVSAEVGPGPSRPIDVVVMDPARQANGFAIPLTGHPRMAIFPTAPSAGSGLAWYRSWAEDLVVHEDAHLVHLMRPSRSPLWRGTLGLLGVEPMLGVPAWVIEGYATVVEGRLTGMGRPHGDLRAAWLRVLAQDGRLPAYEELDGDDTWMGGSHRYLVGSAFLEWLERRACAPPADVPAPGGCRALPDLWARVTARELRGFDEAFAGVFGEGPQALYDRFRAEVGHAAMEQERARAADDSLWLDLEGGTGEPALSPDGGRLVVSRRVEGRSLLQVYETAEDPDALADWLAPHQEAAARDPQDVVAVPPRTLPRDPAATREDLLRPAAHPRFLPDGKRVLISVWEADARGQLRPDLFAWTPGGGEQRVTRGADLTQADPGPDGTWAVALRRRWSQDELVRVDLVTGGVTALSTPPVGVVLDAPRLDPDGRRVAYLRHDGAWRLVVRDLATGAETLPELPAGASVADPCWASDGATVLLALGQQGYVDIWAVRPEDGARSPLTASRGVASAPTPTPDGLALYHLGLDSDGVDLHRLPLRLDRPAPPPPTGPPPVRPPLHPDPPEGLSPDDSGVTARRYGLGQAEWLPLLGGGVGPGAGTVEAGLRLGDVIGRHEVLLLGAWGLGEEAPAPVGGVGGGALRLRWAGPPVGPGGVVEAHGAWLVHGPLGRRAGGQLLVGADRRGPTTRWSWRLGGLGLLPLAGDPHAAWVAGHGRADAAQRFGRVAWFEPRGGLSGQVGGAGHRQVSAWAGAALGLRAWTLEGLFGRALAAGAFTVGGLPSSLVPQPLAGAWVAEPWLAPGALSGPLHDRVDLRLGSGGSGLFAARHWLRDGDEEQAAGAVGLRLEGTVPAQPLVRLPRTTLDAGLACVVEARGRVDLDRCGALDGYAAWFSVRWGG
ncbi:hypothetical protein L6R53_15030 [Myxococcota bacterium]|nr:hypothetical protein [Myxococcota bacterium]